MIYTIDADSTFNAVSQAKGDRKVRYYQGGSSHNFQTTECISTGAREPVFECPVKPTDAEKLKVKDLSTSLQQSMDKAAALAKVQITLVLCMPVCCLTS